MCGQMVFGFFLIVSYVIISGMKKWSFVKSILTGLAVSGMIIILDEKISDYKPFEKIYPDKQYMQKVISLADSLGYELKSAKVFCTDSVCMEYSHLDEIRASGAELIEMETGTFYTLAELFEVPAIALLAVSDNSATGDPLLGGGGEDMTIDHMALYVNELEAVRDFFITYFNGRSNEGYRNDTTGFSSYFISFEDGSRLELMTRPEMEDNAKSIYRTGYAHIAFSVGSREEVDRLTKQLADAGYELLSGPRTTGDGYYESCIIGIEGNMIEITV